MQNVPTSMCSNVKKVRKSKKIQKNFEFFELYCFGFPVFPGIFKSKIILSGDTPSNTWWKAEVRCCSIFKSRINFMKYIYFLYWPYWYNVKWNFGRKKYSYLYFSKEFSTKDVKNFKTPVSRYEILVCIFLDFDASYMKRGVKMLSIFNFDWNPKN